MKTWAHDWWVTLRFGSIFTRRGRELRRAMRTLDSAEWVEVPRP